MEDCSQKLGSKRLGYFSAQVKLYCEIIFSPIPLKSLAVLNLSFNYEPKSIISLISGCYIYFLLSYHIKHKICYNSVNNQLLKVPYCEMAAI